MAMTRYYSKTTGTTYLDGIHSSMPKDAVKIDEQRFIDVLINTPADKTIGHDGSGLPILVDKLPEDKSPAERAWRDAELVSSDWLVSRHRDEIDMNGAPASLSIEQFGELLAYRQELRDWPLSNDFPSQAHRPMAPEWLTETI